MRALAEGTCIDDRYAVEAQAGAGGMGTVVRARDLVHDELVALKVLRGRRDDQVKRFLREAAVLAELRHPAIAQFLGHGTLPDGSPYLVMEWIAGPALSERIRRGPLGIDAGLRLCARIADALGSAHAAGVVHRDVKPANIMLPDDDVDAAKLVDFGLARRMHAGATSLTETGTFMGTLRYMAPEQARDAKHVDSRSDVYALGAVLYEVLVGRPAICGSDAVNVLAKIILEPTPRAREQRPDLPPAVDDLIASLMAKEPDARPADGYEARRQLERIAARMEMSGPGAVSGTAAPAGISAKERRLRWIILVADQGSSEERTRVFVEPRGDHVSRRNIAEARGGELELLADGTALITFGAGGGDESGRAAMTALAWSARFPSARVALAVASAVRSGKSSASAGVGAVIDRAVAALSVAGPGAIRVEPVAASLLERRFVVVANELLGQRAAEGTQRQVIGRQPALVGRRRELAALLDALEDSMSESSLAVVAIHGDAGLGKSRLLSELALHAAQINGLTIVRGQVDALEEGAPFALLSSLFRDLAGIERGENLQSARRKLSGRVGVHVHEASRDRVVAFIGEAISIPPADAADMATARRDAEVMGSAILGAVEDFFAAEAAAGPILMILDDVHWADIPSLRLVRELRRHLAEMPVTIVLSGRPEMGERFGDMWRSIGADVIALRPLTRNASEELLRLLLGSEGPDVADVAQRSGGNPLFIEELARAAAFGREDLADTILGAIQARLDEIDGEARRVLRAASVFGTRFWYGGVAALIDAPDATLNLDGCLAALQTGEIVMRCRSSSLSIEREYQFLHDLIREGAYAMLTDEDRARGHALAGEWLERAGARDAEMLATHFQRGGVVDKAKPWLMLAAQQALDGNDFGRAVARADDALAGGADVVAMSIVKAHALRCADRYADAVACAREALSRAASGTSAWYRASIELSLSCAFVDGYDEIEELSAAVRDAPATTGVIVDQVSAISVAAWMLQHGGRVDAAFDLAVRAEQLADANGVEDPLSRAHLSGVRALRAYHAGDMATYLRESERSRDLYAAAGHQRHSTVQALNVVVGYIGVGCYDRVIELGPRLIQMVQRLGLRNRESFARSLISNAHLELGDFDAAEDNATAALAIAVEVQSPRHLGYAEMLLGRIASARGDRARAGDKLDAALRHFESIPPYRVHALGALALERLRAGNPQSSLEAVEEAQGLNDRIGVGGASAGNIALVHAEALLALGRRDEAVAVAGIAARAVIERADGFRDDWLRERYLTGIEAHARLCALHRELLQG